MTELLKDIPFDDFKNSIGSSGVRIVTGPFVTKLRTKLPDVINNTALLYADYPVLPCDGFSDFHLDIEEKSGIRRLFRPQVNFTFDKTSPFLPLPRTQAYAIFEWGLNWCISNYAHQYLMIHAAVIENNNSAFILPGIPGAGKSTLCAALTLSGWRLFSDEMALIDPKTVQLISNARPISLKNKSIGIIKSFSTDTIFGLEIAATSKGTISHLRPPIDSIKRCSEPSLPKYVIFPEYKQRSKTTLTPISKSRAFMLLCDNSFNYDVLGQVGFKTAKKIISQCECYKFEYSNLQEAIAVFDSLNQKDYAESGIHLR